MVEYLPLGTQSGPGRSKLEAMQRAAGLQSDAVTTHWHAWIEHPLTGEHALVIQDDADKEYLDASELTALIDDTQADNDDWFIDFED